MSDQMLVFYSRVLFNFPTSDIQIWKNHPDFFYCVVYYSEANCVVTGRKKKKRKPKDLVSNVSESELVITSVMSVYSLWYERSMLGWGINKFCTEMDAGRPLHFLSEETCRSCRRWKWRKTEASSCPHNFYILVKIFANSSIILFCLSQVRKD